MFRSHERQPSGSTYMSSTQKAEYLKDLRKVVRPTGSRPPPPSKYTHDTKTTRNDNDEIKDSRPAPQQSNSMPNMPNRQSRTSIGSHLGRPLACGPEQELKKTPSYTYLDNGTRWMEKQEVKSLRAALSDMDLAAEQRVHKAAQEEAAELVWKHQNASQAYRNPDARKSYMSHLRKGSYQRSNEDAAPVVASRSSSASSTEGEIKKLVHKVSGSLTSRKVSPTENRRSSSKSYGELADMVRKDIAESRRRTSSGSRRMMSGEKKYFMHPDDKIWEDAEESPRPLSMVPDLRPPPAAVPSYVRKNPFARVRMQQDRLERSNSAPLLTTTASKHDRIEIQRNPPSQSRNPEYTASREQSPQLEPTIEKRGDDIRAATSKLRRDRSTNLPQPTFVSDKPGRPIVSFEEPKEVRLEEAASTRQPHSQHDRPTSSGSRPSSSATTIVRPNWSSNIPVLNLPDETLSQPGQQPVPTICLPDEPAVPTLSFPDEQPTIPTICLPDDPPAIPTIDLPDKPVDQRPHTVIPTISRPLPTRTPKSTPHYSPSIRQASVLCAHCALPIAGRTLSAAGERFHPGCFVCHECNCNLELVAFYPEPETKRAERVERIHARQTGHLADDDGTDGDETLRFYCHLDFHETFSPRCKSCKTPIEGEIIVACGAEWHAGHFFCAQCGDPFDSTTPFVEKDGYAWCVGCHTNRYSSKCRKCKKPVIDVVVKALNADWHSECFRCLACNGEFTDGRYFLRGESQDPVCVRCEEIRLKA